MSFIKFIWNGNYFQMFIIYASLIIISVKTAYCNKLSQNQRSEWVIGFNVVYQQFRAKYDRCCQICCNWSRLKPDFTVPVHWSTTLQTNMIPHPVTLNWHWVNHPCSSPLMVNANQRTAGANFSVFSEWALYPPGHEAAKINGKFLAFVMLQLLASKETSNIFTHGRVVVKVTLLCVTILDVHFIHDRLRHQLFAHLNFYCSISSIYFTINYSKFISKQVYNTEKYVTFVIIQNITFFSNI